jgi:2-polyprenyl-3-methyl-5-hydroxy-6-metoxy-1,4-benzoquinol methylase
MDAVYFAMKKVLAQRTFTTVLDVGAGYGSMCAFLSNLGTVDAVERNIDARATCATRGYRTTYTNLADAPTNTYDLVAAFDVIEHIQDDAVFIAKIRDSLVTDGVLVATVPAFSFLWSEHDVVHEHCRRHTVRSMQARLEKDFVVRYAKYWNTTLFVPATCMRLIHQTGTSTLKLPRMINQMLCMLLYMEARVLPHVWTLPGTGLVVIAQKKPSKSSTGRA